MISKKKIDEQKNFMTPKKKKLKRWCRKFNIMMLLLYISHKSSSKVHRT